MTQGDRLIWIDLEMTGLAPERDRIIEIATVVTDADLAVIAEGPVIAVRQPEAAIVAMDEWNTRTHTGSGLVARVRASLMDEAATERATMLFDNECKVVNDPNGAERKALAELRKPA